MKRIISKMGVILVILAMFTACGVSPASSASSSRVISSSSSSANSSGATSSDTSSSLGSSSVASSATSSITASSSSSSSVSSSSSSVVSSFSFSSSSTSWSASAQTLPAVTSANFNSYSISLPAYGFKVIYLSNYSKPSAYDTSAGWWKDAVGYQVFVRSFYDSDGNGIGDLAGLSSKLDYITNLGCDLVWTLPIFGSPSIHGYDITNYYTIEPDYGNQSDFDNYVSAAHTRGVRVVLDMVLNHSSDQNPWFKASHNPSDPNYATYKDWYVWTNASLSTLDSAGWGAPWGGGSASSVWVNDSTRGELLYTAFGYGGMPDFNYNNQAVRDEMTNVAAFWLNKGVDGYRMDGARYIVETGPGVSGQADTAGTLQWWGDYHSAIKSFKSDAFTVGEVWTAESTVANYYDNGQGLDMSFSFDFFDALKDVFVNQSSANLRTYLAGHSGMTAPWHFFAPFMDNHDQLGGTNTRLIDSIGGSFEALRAAAAITLTFPGTPFIYYGTEYGMKKSGDSGDIAKRTPMQWNTSANAGFTTGTPWHGLSDYSDPRNVAAQLADTNSVWYSFRDLIRLRKAFPELRRGGIETVNAANNALLAYVRSGSNGSVLVVVNTSSNNVNTTLDFSSTGLSSSSTYPLAELLGSPSNTTVVTNYLKNYPTMYIRGTFNSWGTSNPMTLTADHTWSVNLSLSGTTEFKFDASGDWSVISNWGDNTNASGVGDGVGDTNGDNIVTTKTGAVNINFNDSTLNYTIN